MKANQDQINQFLAQRHMAIVGVSRNSKKFGHQVFMQLKSMNYHLYPVHREADSIEGVKCYRTIEDLPVEVQAICLITPKHQTDDLLTQSIKKGISHIWVQQMSEGQNTEKIARDSAVNIVMGRCIFMYTNPKGIHKFHRQLNKLFGTIAK